MKKLFCMVFILAMIFMLVMTSAFAATQYKVVVDGGSHGTFGGKDSVTLYFNGQGTGLWNSTEFLSSYPISYDSDKYYIKGFHISGHSEDVSTLQVTQDYVIVAYYGVKGDQVPYYIEYIDTTGKTIANKETRYGNVGDHPVIAFKYIEGYTPYNTLSFTTSEGLKAGQPKTFTFIYEEAGAGGTIIYDDTLVYTGGGATGATAGGAGGGGGGGAGAQQGPEEIVDIDNPSVPTTVPTNPDNPNNPSGPPTIIDPEPTPTTKPSLLQYMGEHPIIAAGAIILLVLAALLLILLAMRRKKI